MPVVVTVDRGNILFSGFYVARIRQSILALRCLIARIEGDTVVATSLRVVATLVGCILMATTLLLLRSYCLPSLCSNLLILLLLGVVNGRANGSTSHSTSHSTNQRTYFVTVESTGDSTDGRAYHMSELSAHVGACPCR